MTDRDGLCVPASPSNTLRIILRPPWIYGIPVPWPLDVKNAVEFNNTFVAQLAQNTQISGLAADEKFKPALYLSAGKATLGLVPSDASNLMQQVMQIPPAETATSLTAR